MVGSSFRLVAAAAFCTILAGCTSAPNSGLGDTNAEFGDAGVTTPDAPLQCVPYARERSHIALYGDASTWWDKAAGRYARGAIPSEGAVMVLHDYAGSERGHLAVVG